jgi:hypothetical protein
MESFAWLSETELIKLSTSMQQLAKDT